MRQLNIILNLLLHMYVYDRYALYTRHLACYAILDFKYHKWYKDIKVSWHSLDMHAFCNVAEHPYWNKIVASLVGNR